jgi:hypothetical protein
MRPAEFLELKEGQTLEAPPFVLHKADSFIAGRLLDQDGKPAPGIRISLSPSLPPRTVTTDADGRFRFDNIVPGQPLSLRVSSDGLMASSQVTAPAEDVTLTLRPAPVRRPAAPRAAPR